MLTVPHDGKNLKALENLITSSDAHFKTSSVLSLLPERLTPDSYVPRLHIPQDVIQSIETVRWNQRNDDSINTLLRILLFKIPRNSLRSF